MSFPVSPVESTFVRACKAIDICNPDVKDGEIAERIKQKYPQGVYSKIIVRSMDHEYEREYLKPTLPSRMVQIQTGNFESFRNIFRILFRKTEINTLNVTQLRSGVLGWSDPKSQAELRSAFWQNYTIKLFVAMDGSYKNDPFPGQGKVTQVVSNVFGKKTKPKYTVQRQR